MKTRHLIERLTEAAIPVEGQDNGAPYHIDLDIANDDIRGAQLFARQFGLTASRGPNGYPTVTGTVPTLAVVRSLAKRYGAEAIVLEPETPGGTSVIFE